MLRKIANGVPHQIATFCTPDAGGGGTTANDLSRQLNTIAVDIGVGVMNMHSWFEIVGVGDMWSMR